MTNATRRFGLAVAVLGSVAASRPTEASVVLTYRMTATDGSGGTAILMAKVKDLDRGPIEIDKLDVLSISIYKPGYEGQAYGGHPTKNIRISGSLTTTEDHQSLSEGFIQVVFYQVAALHISPSVVTWYDDNPHASYRFSGEWLLDGGDVATPEPSTIVMIGTAVPLGLAYAWRRRKPHLAA